MTSTRFTGSAVGASISRRRLIQGAAAGVALGGMLKPAFADKRPLMYAYANWNDCLAITNIGAQLITEKFGYEVTQVQGEVAVIYASLQTGKVDVFSATYLEGMGALQGVYKGGQADYMNKVKGSVHAVGVSAGPYSQGFVVPDYVPIESIEELNANAAKFDGKIVGIDAGSGLFQAGDKAIQDYGLQFKQVPGSEAAMLGALKRAYDRKEWIVVTAVTPHPVWAEYKLKYLKDPKNVLMQEAFYDFHVLHKDFDANFPGVRSFFEKFHISNEEVSKVMHWIDEGATPADAAKRWISENRGKGMIEQWLS